VPKIVKYV